MVLATDCCPQFFLTRFLSSQGFDKKEKLSVLVFTGWNNFLVDKTNRMGYIHRNCDETEAEQFINN